MIDGGGRSSIGKSNRGRTSATTRRQQVRVLPAPFRSGGEMKTRVEMNVSWDGMIPAKYYLMPMRVLGHDNGDKQRCEVCVPCRFKSCPLHRAHALNKFLTPVSRCVESRGVLGKKGGVSWETCLTGRTTGSGCAVRAGGCGASRARTGTARSTGRLTTGTTAVGNGGYGNKARKKMDKNHRKRPANEYT